jgi:hypothetical protein
LPSKFEQLLNLNKKGDILENNSKNIEKEENKKVFRFRDNYKACLILALILFTKMIN